MELVECEGAKNEGMIDRVEMRCKDCEGVVHYVIRDSCPSCGLINIWCNNCNYKYSFGE